MLTYLVDLVATFFRANGLPPEKAQNAAEELGRRVADRYGGQILYFPRGAAIKVDERRRQIVAKFNGMNHSELSAEFGLCVQHVYRILAEERKRSRGAAPPEPSE